jgi:hypothetical protein
MSALFLYIYIVYIPKYIDLKKAAILSGVWIFFHNQDFPFKYSPATTAVPSVILEYQVPFGLLVSEFGASEHHSVSSISIF